MLQFGTPALLPGCQLGRDGAAGYYFCDRYAREAIRRNDRRIVDDAEIEMQFLPFPPFSKIVPGAVAGNNRSPKEQRGPSAALLRRTTRRPRQLYASIAWTALAL